MSRVDHYPPTTLVDVYVPESVRSFIAEIGETPLHEDEQGYLARYEGDDAVVMILGGPTIVVPDFCVTSAEGKPKEG